MRYLGFLFVLVFAINSFAGLGPTRKVDPFDTTSATITSVSSTNGTIGSLNANSAAIKKASIAGGYVTSLNKVDGSFEDGTAGWLASTDNIVQTASTEFQGNYKGVWSGTGAGTLDLQWTATASNTYEASTQVNVQGKNNVYVCAYVGTTETGCKLIPALNKIQKVSVVADSVISSAFNLRLKHTGSDAFSIDVDDGKIEPWTPQAVNLVETQTYALFFTSSGITYNGNFLTAPVANFSSGSGLFIKDTSVTQIRLKALKKIIMTGNVDTSVATGGHYTVIRKNGVQVQYGSVGNAVNHVSSVAFSLELIAGDYIEFENTNPNTAYAGYTVTATAISDNVVQSWQDGTEWTDAGVLTIKATTTDPTKGTTAIDKVRWKRVGSDAHIRIEFQQSGAGSAGSGDYLFKMPANLKIDTTKVTPYATVEGDGGFAGRNNVGSFVGTAGSSGAFTYSGGVFVYDKDYVRLGGAYGGSTGAGSAMVGSGNLNLGSAGAGYIATFIVPIQGWSSTPTLLALPTSKDNNKTYDLTQVSLTSSDATISNGEGTFYPYRTISKTTGLPIWRLAFNVGVTTNSLAAFNLKISGITSPNKLQSVTNVSTDGGTVANTGVLLASGNTINVAAGASKTNWRISGDVELASKPTWADEWVEPGVFVGSVAKNQVAYVKDIKPSGTESGPATSGSWGLRDLNTIEGDPIVSVSSNKFTLQAGEYEIESVSPFLGVNAAKTRLYNFTNPSVITLGSVAYSAVADSVNSDSFIRSKITLTSATELGIQYLVQSTKSTNGLGAIGTLTGDNNVFTQVKITKLNGN